jgi:hypothetical protein
MFEISAIPVAGECAASTNWNVTNRYEILFERLEYDPGFRKVKRM